MKVGPQHRIMTGVAVVLLVLQCLTFVTLWSRSQQLPSSHADLFLPPVASGITHLQDESNVPIPKNVDGAHMSFEDRLRYLEMKVNAFMNFGTDPFFGASEKSSCKKSTDLTEFGCHPGWEGYYPKCSGLFDHQVCLDNLPKPNLPEKEGELPQAKLQPCLVYDFGVREQPQFGAVMARTFGCEVHAFDPSPVSTKWWDSKEANKLRNLANYHFHPYGAGGVDGTVTLKEYDWGQVSIMRYPTYLRDCSNASETDDSCPHKHGAVVQSSFQLNVKTLSTIRKELGHTDRKIDVLKVDVEGSEYAFLENMLDMHAGCPDFLQQITLEWHHMPWDARYGEGSSPSINAIVTLLHACGLKMFWQHSPGGWPSNQHYFDKMNMHDVRYNLASFHRESK